MLPWQPPNSFSSAADGGSNSQSQGNYRPLFNQTNDSNANPPPNQSPPPQQPAPAAAPVYGAPTLASTLHFLQSEHRRYARDRNEWEIERAEMRARIALLEGEKRGNEGALRDLGRRCKMLEMALRGERSKFLSTTNALGNTAVAGQTPSASGTSSPIPATAAPLPAMAKAAPAAPVAAAAAAATASATSPESAAMAPSTSMTGAPASAVAPVHAAAGLGPHGPGISVHAAHLNSNGPSRPVSQLGLNGQTATWGAGGIGGATLAGGRDPRGKARSRDYLKQCLQEITYLTSSTTLNPLGPTSFGAPAQPRPRKVLPDHVPLTSAAGGAAVPGLLSLPGGLSGLTANADVPSTAPAPAPVTTAVPATGSAPAQGRQIADFKSASDPASSFVPLKRTISQPGQPGPRAIVPTEAVPALEEEPTADGATAGLEGGPPAPTVAEAEKSEAPAAESAA